MATEVITREDLQSFRQQLLQDLTALLNRSASASAPQWLRSREVRARLKISSGTLQTLRTTGRLTPSKVGGTYYYKWEEVEALLSQKPHGA
ncbi:MAG TPA: helix-turn-helix domain-containing protein [Chitinophagaceae bacterium]|jgi:hypothetical protein|nr:helix-turn-helix domain-containing protein [Chitinophagaceae bacterium]